MATCEGAQALGHVRADGGGVLQQVFVFDHLHHCDGGGGGHGVAAKGVEVATFCAEFGQNFGALVRHIDSAAAFWGYGVGSMVLGAMILWFWFKRSGFLDH